MRCFALLCFVKRSLLAFLTMTSELASHVPTHPVPLSPASSEASSAILLALTSSLNLGVTLEHLQKALAPHIALDGIFVNIRLTDPDRVVFLASSDRQGGRLRDDVVALPKAILAQLKTPSAEGVLVHTLDEDPFTAWVAPQCVPGIQSFVMLRCQLEGQHLGIVCFWSYRPNAFNVDDLAFLLHFRHALSLNVGFAVTSRLRNTMAQMQKEAQRLRETLAAQRWEPLDELLKNTPSMVKLAPELKRLAPYDATVLITGESGTGKEVLATVIQQMSRRAHKPFVKINCAAVTPTLIESELFGYEKGAFTGANARHAGLFEQADGGTLFLDEVGELSPDMQVKLLRVIQQQTLRRIGGTQEIAVDVRLIAATNQPLRKLVNEGRFRLDLFYRLAVVPIHLPPLSERPEDLAPLGEYFLKSIARKYGVHPAPILSERALEMARRHPWVGNVREWRNVLARAVLSGQNPIDVLDFSDETQLGVAPTASSVATVAVAANATPPALTQTPASQTPALTELSFEAMQRRYFSAILEDTHGRIAGPFGAAKRTGLNPNTLRSRLQKLGLL